MSNPILLVEDDDNDVLFMRLAMEKADVGVPLQVARDGREALSYLCGDGRFSDRQQYPLPCLVLLDLRLPRIPGLEVLRWVRAQPNFDHMPMIVFSSSNQDIDVREAYEAGADSYVIKPARPRELTEIVRRLKFYWIDQVQPPRDCQEWEAISVNPTHLSRERHSIPARP
jgi:CheY-like chemotaxis protein